MVLKKIKYGFPEKNSKVENNEINKSLLEEKQNNIKELSERHAVLLDKKKEAEKELEAKMANLKKLGFSSLEEASKEVSDLESALKEKVDEFSIVSEEAQKRLNKFKK